MNVIHGNAVLPEPQGSVCPLLGELVMEHQDLRDHQNLNLSLLAYLLAYPDAKDSIQGIHACWLSGLKVPPRRDQLQLALEDLVGQGLLVVSQHSSGSTQLYQLNRQRLKEIKIMLNVPS